MDVFWYRNIFFLIMKQTSTSYKHVSSLKCDGILLVLIKTVYNGRYLSSIDFVNFLIQIIIPHGPFFRVMYVEYRHQWQRNTIYICSMTYMIGSAYGMRPDMPNLIADER